MLIPKFESHTTRESNPGGETLHPEDSYNLEDGDRDRKEMEDVSKRSKGQEPYVPIEEVEDKDAEQAIYDYVEESIQKEDVDEFGYIAMMNEIVAKLAKEEKEEFLDNVSIFIALNRKVVNEKSLSDKEKDKLLREKFTQIFGHQVLSYDAESGATSMSMYKNKFVKVTDKAAPTYAYKPEYIKKNGRSVAVDKREAVSVQEEGHNFKEKTKKQGLLYKLPFRKKNR